MPKQSDLFSEDTLRGLGMIQAAEPEPEPEHSVRVHFESDADVASFAEAIGQRVTTATRECWWPERRHDE